MTRSQTMSCMHVCVCVCYLQHVPSHIVPQTPAQCVQYVADLRRTKRREQTFASVYWDGCSGGAVENLIWGEDAVETVQQDLQLDGNRLSSIQDQGAQVEHQPGKSHFHWAAARGWLGLEVELLHGWRGRGRMLCYNSHSSNNHHHHRNTI